MWCELSVLSFGHKEHDDEIASRGCQLEKPTPVDPMPDRGLTSKAMTPRSADLLHFSVSRAGRYSPRAFKCLNDRRRCQVRKGEIPRLHPQVEQSPHRARMVWFAKVLRNMQTMSVLVSVVFTELGLHRSMTMSADVHPSLPEVVTAGMKPSWNDFPCHVEITRLQYESNKGVPPRIEVILLHNSRRPIARSIAASGIL